MICVSLEMNIYFLFYHHHSSVQDVCFSRSLGRHVRQFLRNELFELCV